MKHLPRIKQYVAG